MIVLGLAGRALTVGRGGPGLHLIAGWGAYCLVMVCWGILGLGSLRYPAGAFILASLAGLAVRGDDGGWRRDLGDVGRVLVLMAPLLWVVADIEPSQLDVFTLMLPNSAYLFDHAFFPFQAGPPAYSDAALAPYHTELVPFLGSLAGGGFAPNGLSLFTVLMHLAPALLFMRVVAGGAGGGWLAAAVGFGLATVINPGFVPRISFTGYGEAPMAIALLFAGWQATTVMERLAAGERWPRALAVLALVLVALIGVKQQAVGLFVAVAVAMIVIAGRDSRIGWRTAFRAFGTALAPAICLYLAWRGYVLLRFPAGELKSLPFNEWEWFNLPANLRSMLRIVGEKPYYFGSVLAMAVLAWRRSWPLSAATRRLVDMGCVVFILYTGVLVMMYVAHFRGTLAHSFFRYNTHMSLLVVGCLVMAGRDLAVAGGLAVKRGLRLAGGVLLVLMVVAPVAFSPLLRFDRDMPQPLLRFQVRNLAAELKDDDRVALLLPGDNTTVTWGMTSLLRFSHPRRLGLDIREADDASPATFARVAEEGYHLAFLSCTDGNSLGLPGNAAALLTWSEAGGWTPTRVWPYPPVGKRQKWSWTGFIAQEPFCLR